MSAHNIILGALALTEISLRNYSILRRCGAPTLSVQSLLTYRTGSSTQNMRNQARDVTGLIGFPRHGMGGITWCLGRGRLSFFPYGTLLPSGFFRKVGIFRGRANSPNTPPITTLEC